MMKDIKTVENFNDGSIDDVIDLEAETMRDADFLEFFNAVKNFNASQAKEVLLWKEK